jgi:hypothetical protein
VTALAHSDEIELTVETGAAETPRRRGAGWRFRALADAVLLVSAFAGSWAVVLLLAVGLARIL